MNYEELVAEKKHLIVEKNLAGDLDRLTQNLKQIATQTRKGSDFTIVGLKKALAEVKKSYWIQFHFLSDNVAQFKDTRLSETWLIWTCKSSREIKKWENGVRERKGEKEARD